MLLDDGHNEFILKLKRYVHLEVLLAALSRDRKQLSHLKMGRCLWMALGSNHRPQKDMTELRLYSADHRGKLLRSTFRGANAIIHQLAKKTGRWLYITISLLA
jgi:hypothetical protein